MMKARSFRLLIGALVGLASAAVGPCAVAAVPRVLVELHSDTVKLSDLFTDLEPGQDCDLGPAPNPGHRIVVEEPQLAAIAQQFGVDWQPSSGVTRVTLERKARIVGRDDLLPLLKTALAGAGAPRDSDIVILGTPKLVLPAEATGQPEITTFSYDPASGRFSADLQFSGSLAEAVTLHLDGSAQEMVEIPVLSHSLRAGIVLAASDFHVRRIRKSQVPDQALLDAAQGVGLALRHQALVDQPIPTAELMRPALVVKGMPIVLRLEDRGIILTAQGQALESGALSERIHVLNTASRAILVAEVTGAAEVKVDPATAPVFTRAGMASSALGYGQSNSTPPYNY